MSLLWPDILSKKPFQIIDANDEMVERFAVLMGNDTDPVQADRYKQMRCSIAPDCDISANTQRILEKMFGEITTEFT